MPIDAVMRDVELPAHEPLPKGQVAGVQCRMPVMIPAQEVSIFFEALWKVFLAEPFHHGRIDQVGCPMNFADRVEMLLLFQWTAICASLVSVPTSLAIVPGLLRVDVRCTQPPSVGGRPGLAIYAKFIPR